jgi:hypothetical protein
MAAEGTGILSIAQLDNDARAVFRRQDPERWDGQLDHISCSIEYPNAWYLAQKKTAFGEAANFPDWTMLGIDPRHLLDETTLFCPENAGAGKGSGLKPGLAGFEALYAERVTNSKGSTYSRSDDRIRACPTNDQAEAMIYQRIPLESIKTIFVPDADQASRQYIQLEQIGVDPHLFGYVIAPSLFNPRQLSAEIRDGIKPSEIPWDPEV